MIHRDQNAAQGRPTDRAKVSHGRVAEPGFGSAVIGGQHASFAAAGERSAGVGIAVIGVVVGVVY